MIHLTAQSGYGQLPYSRLKLLNHDPPNGSVWLRSSDRHTSALSCYIIMIHLMAQPGYGQLPYSRLKLLYNHDPPYGSVRV